MKKIYVILSGILLLTGCDTNNVKVEQTEHLIRYKGVDIITYTIDSCQYIGNLCGGNGTYLTHKGNCKYCAKRNIKNK